MWGFNSSPKIKNHMYLSQMPVRAPARWPPKCLFLLRNLYTPVTVCSDEVQNREWSLTDSLDNNFQ